MGWEICKDCSLEVPNGAPRCPHCGSTRKSQSTLAGLPALFIIAGILLFILGGASVAANHQNLRLAGGALFVLGVIFLFARLVSSSAR